MRKGREFYKSLCEDAVKLHKQGKTVKDIAKELNVSYSAAYHWVKGLRKPKPGKVEEFIKFLKQKGPTPAAEVPFKKHNELFLRASRRGLPIKRDKIGIRQLKDYAWWYYLEGQEKELYEKQEKLKKKFEHVKSEILDTKITIE